MKNIYLSFILLLGLIVTANFSCQKDEVEEPATNEPPSLTDDIPYEKLGSGTIVFQRWGDRYNAFYVIDIDNKESRWIKGSLTFDPKISPNGDQIVYWASTFGCGWSWRQSIFVTEINGSDGVLVADVECNTKYPCWNADGQKILFFRDYNFIDTPILYIQTPIPDPLDRTEIREFTFNIDNEQYLIDPYSPVSVSSLDKVVFNITTPGIKGLYTMDIDGSNVELLVSCPDSIIFMSPVYSPDGQQIACLSFPKVLNHVLEIFVVDFDGSNKSSILSILNKQAYLSEFAHPAYSICWSPDGSKLLFNISDNEDESHLYAINSDGSGLIEVTSAEGVIDVSPSWGN